MSIAPGETHRREPPMWQVLSRISVISSEDSSGENILFGGYHSGELGKFLPISFAEISYKYRYFSSNEFLLRNY